MQVVKIPHRATHRFSTTIIDYLEGNEKLNPFYKYSFDVDSIEKVINDKSKENIDRKLLVDVLLDQNREFVNQFSDIRSNIELLNNTNSFTITTGHQLCVFGGPLYFITKVISVIKTCKLLSKQYPQHNFIPVFWLASEDHGRGEVSSIHLFGKTLQWTDDSLTPTGWISSSKLNSILEEIKEILGNSDAANELYTIFSEAYNGKRNLAEATRYYLTQLFGDDGLVILDGDDRRLKQKIVPIIKEEITTSIANKLVAGSTEKLESIGYKGQVFPREINFFYLSDEGRVAVENTDEFIGQIESNPERFSPNVIYRPLYQELVLPNLAYIGGPGETVYWFQLKSLFEYYKINFPMLIVRDNSMIIPRGIQKKIEKFNLTIEGVFSDKQTVEKSLLQELATIDITLEKELNDLSGIFYELRSKVEQIDPTLVPAVEGERTRQIKSFEGFSKRLHKAEKRKQEETLQQFNSIHDKLFPVDKLQERYENFMPFYLQKQKMLFKQLEEHFDPFEKKFIVFIED